MKKKFKENLCTAIAFLCFMTPMFMAGYEAPPDDQPVAIQPE